MDLALDLALDLAFDKVFVCAAEQRVFGTDWPWGFVARIQGVEICRGAVTPCGREAVG